jgi:hypothetical protein
MYYYFKLVAKLGKKCKCSRLAAFENIRILAIEYILSGTKHNFSI